MNDFKTRKTPDKIKLRVKPGCIAVHNKWKNSEVFSGLKNFFNGATLADLNTFDFSFQEMNIIYYCENKMISGVDVNHILSLTGVVFIADRNSLTVEVFSQMQNALIPFGISFLPVGHRGEVPLLVYQLYLSQVLESPGSSFRFSTKSAPGIQLQILQTVPGLGQTKAAKLLDYFGTVDRVISASEYALLPVVGEATASQVYKFFNYKHDSGG